MKHTVDVLLAVKPLSRAKSRLRDGYPAPVGGHAGLVTAMVLDTVTAARRALGVGRVLVVTDDHALTQRLREHGVDFVDEGTATDLNAALRHGEQVLRDRGRGAVIVGALQADLPALRPTELGEALASAAGRRAYCADHHGVGTTLLIAAPGEPLDPRFGDASALAHAESGAVELTGSWPSLRRDVDTAEDLAAASALGLGEHTAAVYSPAR
ncbi:2-phospho-L-lactate guanylyltransferase [Herbihabitans rhizosphaerae]|uniref:Phosphoenolpyruvate guanylyltransferase n=1 Tax=Herbihabitans rhizosphaerae TaxID=1872711 RepID=A0A4Q7KRZ5_9PSEU|nr:2-phospho-L-lactate guanylyltransferase [Herbihabitans rhizosphaerae]RZS39267.1 2-phospho-L-lactate guanylyltransferase [Herbihabitans rhizosphaerae]